MNESTIGKIVKNLILTHTDKDGIFHNILDHFEMVKMIDYDGTQGRVGILQHKQTKCNLVFKIPLDPGFSVRHEYLIMKSISGSRKFIPNFLEVYGIIQTFVLPDSDSPFHIQKGDSSFLCDVLFTEYIEGSITFTERAFSYNSKIIYSLIRQVLLAIEIGKRKYGLVHYDLHTDNILIKKCPRDSLFLYNMGNTKTILPTYGVYPVVIDFGFSYLKGIPSGTRVSRSIGSTEKTVQKFPLYSNMSHTDGGYLACLFDPYYDARVFLMNISKDLAELNTQREKSFREKVLAYYNHLSIDTARGWDIRKGQYSAAEMVIFTILELEKEENIFTIFSDDGYQCVTILQSLIELPLKNKKNGDFRPHYRLFIREFMKLVEKTVRSNHNKLLLLVQLVESARKSRDIYDNDKEEGVRYFRRNFLHYIDKSLSFYQPSDNVDYKIILENMYNMADCMETIYYRVMKDLIKMKKEQYKKPVENMEIYNMVDIYYSTEYKLTPTSTVYVWDIEKEMSRTVTNFSEKFCHDFNETKNRNRADLMWNYKGASELEE